MIVVTVTGDDRQHPQVWSSAHQSGEVLVKPTADAEPVWAALYQSTTVIHARDYEGSNMIDLRELCSM